MSARNEVRSLNVLGAEIKGASHAPVQSELGANTTNINQHKPTQPMSGRESSPSPGNAADIWGHPHAAAGCRCELTLPFAGKGQPPVFLRDEAFLLARDAVSNCTCISVCHRPDTISHSIQIVKNYILRFSIPCIFWLETSADL